MANDAIGHCRCPWCASKRMRVSLTKGGKVSVMCSACHFQGFARGQLSDMAIRQAMTPATVEPVEAVAVSVETAAPVESVTYTAGQGQEQAPAEPAPVVEKKKERGGWNVFG